jgi:hypothetical protein
MKCGQLLVPPLPSTLISGAGSLAIVWFEVSDEAHHADGRMSRSLMMAIKGSLHQGRANDHGFDRFV